MDYRLARKRYQAQRLRPVRYDAEGTLIEMRLTFEQWLGIWVESGKWELCGNSKGKYCMGRYNDLGHYELGNVSIVPFEENCGDSRRGKSISEEHRRALREANLNKPCKQETKDKLSKLNKGKPMKQVPCEKCGAEISPQNMSRHLKVCEPGHEIKRNYYTRMGKSIPRPK